MQIEASRLRDRDSAKRRARGADTTPRVLLLTSGLGLGHVRASQAIGAALEPYGVHVETIDLWSLMNPGVAQACKQTYLGLVQRHPELYERLYHLDEQTWRQILQSEAGPPAPVLEVLDLIAAIAREEGVNSPRGGRYGSDRLLMSLLCAALPYEPDSLAGNGVRARLALITWAWMRLIRRLEPAIRRRAPHAIVSTQMIPAAMVSNLKQRGKVTAPSIGVMTDFAAHDFWRQRGVDHYCVAHESIEASMQGRYSHASVTTTGVPLMPNFAAPMSQEQARRELDLPAGVPVVLVLGGGLGISIDTAATRLLDSGTHAHLIAMPGRNTQARATLEALARGHPQRFRVAPWTERMDIYIRAADVIVGKPGGVTVAEVLACGRPLLATRSLGGQEGFNVSFLEGRDVGGLVQDAEVLDRVERLLADPDALLQMQRRAWLLGRRDGAARVAERTLDIVLRANAHLELDGT